ncbi:MAG TPA: DASS family sodium-coupled anion symporter [Polyangiaceae bacterium]|nr:DASS family sodium-coupled anion symporter [Polyangiaceae bacterium]
MQQSALEQGRSSFRPGALVLAGAAACLAGLLPIAALTTPAQRTLSILVLVAVLWLTEALPAWVTALLIPALATLLGVCDAKRAFAGFGDPIIFLFFGTFLLTSASFQHGLNARLARSVLGSRFVRGSPIRLLWALAGLGFLISAWVNNTATTVLLLPLALAAETRRTRENAKELVPILLMTAYAPSICGIATPVGSAPNLIGLRLIETTTGAAIPFARWCAWFAPLAAVATVATTLFLARTLRLQSGSHSLPPAPADSSVPPAAWSRAEKSLVWVSAVVISLWIGPGLLQSFGIGPSTGLKAWSGRLPEALVPLLGGLALFVLPSGTQDERILDERVLARIDWSTLLLFGGGLTLGALLFDTGLARWLGEGLFRMLPIGGMFGVVLAATLMAVILSEITSNTASASLVVPIVLSLAQAAKVDPVPPALAATVACSFGFMLPVSTPPNALVFATGRVPLKAMIRYGLLLDVLGVVLVATWVTLLAG